MSIRDFDSIRKIVQDFFGGAYFSIVRESATPGGYGQCGNILVRKITRGLVTYDMVLQRTGLVFSAIEIALAGEVAGAFQTFFPTITKGSGVSDFRAVMLPSLLDVSISSYLRSDRRLAFWSIQKLLQILKDLSFQKYEGKQATTGFIVYRKNIEEFNVACSISDCLMLDFNPGICISPDFFQSPSAYRLVNGLGTYYACNIRLQATGMIKFMNYGSRDAIERLSMRDTMSLLKKAGPGAFAASVTPASELEILTCPDIIFAWRKGHWSLFDPGIYRHFLSGYLDVKETESLIATIYSLSKLRLGAIVLIAEESVLSSGNLQKGTASGKDHLSRLILGSFKNKTITDLKQSGELISILSTDGMTLFNKDGVLVDAGIIINTCTTAGLVTGGGRTTAATAASGFGKVIKVSEDGPVELYENGNRMYRFG